MNNWWENFFEFLSVFYEWAIYFYGLGLLLSYMLLAILSFINIRRFQKRESNTDYKVLVGSPLAPGISIVAPAFNEAMTIIDNVRSLLTLDYPKYEVIIINDGSTDDTLEKVIKEFQLVKTDFAYNVKIKSKPVRGVYKSTNDAYNKLVVVDKENGKSKADASNAGINAAQYPYFVCTDVDCILHEHTLQKLIKPVLEDESHRVIAVGATLRLANSCEAEKGVIVKIHAPRPILARFQELEYIRAFVLGKTGWSLVNAVPNVSGGLGMFDKEIVIKAGGYDPLSFGEDMELMFRMNAYCAENDIKAATRYVPVTLCWTEGPSTFKVLMRQRTRWGRGLFQLMNTHKKFFFNSRYGMLGMVIYPYNFFFELIAPVVELLGIIYYIYLIVTHQVNWNYAIVLMIFVYIYAVAIGTIAVLWDHLTAKYYQSGWDVVRVVTMVLIEIVAYHPLIVYFAVRGYFLQAFNRAHVWGNMQRQGFRQSGQGAKPAPKPAAG
jgi:cellulose synthase/poly-beta-1,6-N-acetylglucosamine synthase-like glycosyltransferase